VTGHSRFNEDTGIPFGTKGGTMGRKRQINAKDILDDLRSGIEAWALQVKYKLSAKSLHAIYKKLVACNAISHSELYELSSFYRDRIDRISGRAYPRADLAVYVPIYEIGAGVIGVLRDISETGLRVAGITSKVGQATTFQIPIDMFIHAEPLLIIAECKWVETKGRRMKYAVAGYAITDLPETDREVLRNFITFLLLSESGEWESIG
jgi:hypothetical protein